jgi:hypothetical protein
MHNTLEIVHLIINYMQKISIIIYIEYEVNLLGLQFTFLNNVFSSIYSILYNHNVIDVSIYIYIIKLIKK